MSDIEEWISVCDDMPKNGKSVLVTYINCLGNRRRIVSYFVERYSVPANADDDGDEYCEEDDTYYLIEGWYEQQDNSDDYASIYITEGEVDFWRELPSVKELPELDRTTLRLINKK